MIDKISGNGVYYPEQNKKKNTAARAYENTPGTKEAAQKKAAGAQKAGLADEAGKSGSGVILDLSKKAARQDRSAPKEKQESFFTAAVRRIFAPIVQWMKAFWESDSTKTKTPQVPEQLSDVQETAAEALDFDNEELPPLDAVTEAEDLKALGEEAVKSGSIQKLEQFVTQNGTKHLAHNSDLLTYYDRRGKIVEMDETQKHRVLFGDKDVLKL